MISNIANDNLRNSKTKKLLYDAMYSLLKSNNLKKITIKSICEQAVISRATFYAHYIDKYDLLNNWITDICINNFNNLHSYEQIEKTINFLVTENTKIIKNLIYEADNETHNILFNIILSIKNIDIKKSENENTYQKNVALANFYAGGILSYINWLINNKFPQNVPPMNRYIYGLFNGYSDNNINLI